MPDAHNTADLENYEKPMLFIKYVLKYPKY